MSEPRSSDQRPQGSFTQADASLRCCAARHGGPDGRMRAAGPVRSGQSTMLQAVGLLEGGFEGAVSASPARKPAGLDGDGTVPHTRAPPIARLRYQCHHCCPIHALEKVVRPRLSTAPMPPRPRPRSMLTRSACPSRDQPIPAVGGEQQRGPSPRPGNRPPWYGRAPTEPRRSPPRRVLGESSH